MWRLSCGTFTRSTIFCIIPVRSSKKCPGLTGRRSRRGAAQPSLRKIVIADEVRRVFSENNMVVVLQHHGLAVAEWDSARYDLADHNIRIKVFPNRVASKALEDTIYKYTQPLFRSTTAVAFSKDPSVNHLFSVLKRHPKLLLIGGKVDNTLMSQDGLREYARLPSAHLLQYELAGIVQSPLVVDLLSAVGLHKDILPLQLPHDVTLYNCSTQDYRAYTIGEQASLNTSLSRLFPSGVYYNFSLLMRVKIPAASKGFILAIQDQEDGPAWFAIRVDVVADNFQKILVQFRSMGQVTSTSVKLPVLTGDQWHSLGLAVVETTVHFYWNCVLKSSQTVLREKSLPATGSKLYVAASGHKKKKAVKVTLSELVIARKPSDASNMCVDSDTRSQGSGKDFLTSGTVATSNGTGPSGLTDKQLAEFVKCPKGEPCRRLPDSLNGKMEAPDASGKSTSVQKGPTGLPGPKGDTGPRGVTGMKGEKGEVGDQGIDGRKGQKGESGVGLPGPPGINGISNATKGDKGEHGPSGLNGSKGEKGNQGPVGPRGQKGEQGIQGMIGRPGRQGFVGIDGLPGIPGIDGINGDPGQPGLWGIKGSKGDRGIQGPVGPRGQSGLKRQPGSKGSKGDIGPVGASGRKGSVGPRGLQGPPGPPSPGWKDLHFGWKDIINITSMAALPGIKGQKGDKGVGTEPDLGRAALVAPTEDVVGPKAERGLPGPKGEQGQKGDKGNSGPPGFYGDPGQVGDKGDKGEPVDGRDGIPGLDGRDGQKGDKGDAGEPGLNGATGLTGRRGPRGYSGLPGSPGPPGISSVHGPKGDKGDPGVAVKGDRGAPGSPGPPGETAALGSNQDGKVGRKGERGFGLEIVSSGVELQTISVEGSIAFRQDEQRLYVRMADGKWKSIPFMDEIMNRSSDIQRDSVKVPSLGSSPSPQACGDGQLQPGEDCDGRNFGGHTCQTLHGETSLGELICSSSCQINISRCTPSSVMLIALNSLHSGSLGGLSGADKMCQDASRISSLTGTFKAFMSGIDRSLKSLISARYRRLPVVNVKKETLFKSWEAMFSGQPAVSYSTLHLNFRGQQVSVLDIWAGPYDDQTGGYGSNETCSGWRSSRAQDRGGSSKLDRPINSQRRLTCNRQLTILCILSL